jgi:O-antigen/teichoic acid export membrane protein
MLQRGIGIAVGALVTLVLLVIMAGGNPWQDYLAPLVIGGVAAFFWPVVIGIWLGRRAKQRREDQVSAEVQRQLDEEHRKSGQ